MRHPLREPVAPAGARESYTTTAGNRMIPAAVAQMVSWCGQRPAHRMLAW